MSFRGLSVKTYNLFIYFTLIHDIVNYCVVIIEDYVCF